MDDLRTIVGIAGVTGVALALGLGLRLKDDDRPEPEARPATPESTLTDANETELRAKLDFEILRGDTVITVQVPSGPLGARFGSLRVLPGN
jgi:hypothetical protein